MNRQCKRILIIGIPLILLLLLVVIVPSWRSHVLMGMITKYENTKVVGKTEGITLKFESPSKGASEGLKWSSPMILFNKFDMPVERLGIPGEANVDMSIYYTFGDFERGTSTIYKEASPYNSAFYGAYVVRINGSIGPVDLTKLTAAITRYDYRVLILYQLGLDINNATYLTQVTEVQKDVSRFGSEGWLKVDAVINTRSVFHEARGFRQHYLQFGWPLKSQLSSDFPEMTLYGRTYAKYFSQEGIYVIFYIQAASPELLEDTDQVLLSKSKVSK